MIKYFLPLSLLFSLESFAQVKIDALVKRNGLTYAPGSNIPFTGKAYAYFADGTPQTMIEYGSGIPNGEIKSWSKKDVKQVEGFIEMGKRTGTWKLYNENGTLKKQSIYRDDKENGEEIFWFSNGKIEKKGTYINGKLNGKYEWFYESGQKKQEGHFTEGKEDSTRKDWYESGKQKMVGNFTHSEKNGTWTWWDENGNVTTSKKYVNGLVEKAKNDFDTYVERMEFFITKRNFKESLKNVELALATLSDKTEKDDVYMGLQLYHSRCYSYFLHNHDAEKILLETIGLTPAQVHTIQVSHIEKSTSKMNEVIDQLVQKDKAAFSISNHIALALSYNILADTVSLQKEQQLVMEKGNMKDWIINISLELYRLAAERTNNYLGLQYINEKIVKEGISEKLEMEKAQYLLRSEKFEQAQAIADKYLKKDGNNLTAVLLKASIEMAHGNVEKMKIYEDRAIAIDPDVFKKATK